MDWNPVYNPRKEEQTCCALDEERCLRHLLRKDPDSVWLTHKSNLYNAHTMIVASRKKNNFFLF